MSRKLFCELSPVCYEISRNKEILRRRLHDLTCGERFARLCASDETVELPNIVKSHTSVLVRRLHGVDIALQENKVTNIRLACERINGITIPGRDLFVLANSRTTDRKGRIYRGTRHLGTQLRLRHRRWTLSNGEHDTLARAEQSAHSDGAAPSFGCTFSR